MLGQLILQKEIVSGNTGNIITLPVEFLAAGLYIVTLRGASQKFSEKVFITR